MKGNGFRVIFCSVFFSGLLTFGAVIGFAQGQPSHPPAPGQMQMIPMYPQGPLPYSWEIGKHRTQKFGDLNTGKRSKEVKKLLKMKMKEQKEKAQKP